MKTPLQSSDPNDLISARGAGGDIHQNADSAAERLGGPNFTKVPVNAPKGCPVNHYRRDGHMHTAPRAGRVKYEPGGRGKGLRAHPLDSAVSYKAPFGEGKARLRPEGLSDHYSRPRTFYNSQTLVEQSHIASALIFELPKCAEPEIRSRIVSYLCTVDQMLAETVAGQLGITPMSAAAPAAAPARMDPAPSAALRMAAKSPDSFHGWVLGVMVSDDFDGILLVDLRKAVAEAKGLVKLFGRRIDGVWRSKHNLHPVDERIGGVLADLFDAIAIIRGTDRLALAPAARSFVIDAFQHCKYIGSTESAKVMLDELGLIRHAEDPANGDQALCALTHTASSKSFVLACKAQRHWPREAVFKP